MEARRDVYKSLGTLQDSGLADREGEVTAWIPGQARAPDG